MYQVNFSGKIQSCLTDFKPHINAVSSVSFKEQPGDSVEISTKKEKRTASEKAAIVSTTITGLLLAGLIAFKTHKTMAIKKLCKEKLVKHILPENIEFKDARTLDEAIKFSKEVLKIKEVDSNFTLDAINYANKGLVDVSNAHKGQVFMPNKLSYKELNDNVIAQVNGNIKDNNFGSIMINSKFFNEEVLNKEIKELLDFCTGCSEQRVFPRYGVTKEIKELVTKFKNSETLSVKEKRNLWVNLRALSDEYVSYSDTSPLGICKEWADVFKESDITCDIEKLKSLSKDEQLDFLKKAFAQLKFKRGRIPIASIGPQEDIFHEMGHLQDFAGNLEKSLLEAFSLKSFIKMSTKDPMGNRWGGLTYGNAQLLYEKSPKKFKKMYPDLYEFLTNDASQKSAGRVSKYAKTSIGEFIADMYARMVELKSVDKNAKMSDYFDDEVIELYKKYGGPMVD